MPHSVHCLNAVFTGVTMLLYLLYNSYLTLTAIVKEQPPVS